MIVEDGNGRADATSYVTVAEASAYLAARGTDTVWTTLDPTVQAQLLQRAADYMAAAYRSKWRGFRANSEQALDWPRQGVQLWDLPTSAQIQYNTIPKEVKQAQIELALRAHEQDLMPDLTRGVVSESVGAVAVTYDRFTPQQVRFNYVDQMLSHLFGATGIMVPIGRC